MRFIKEKLNENKLFETGLARLWQHTKDTSTFAIIGTQDQDTKESRYNDMMDLILKLSRKKAGIGFNNIEGTYTYDNGKRGREDSIIIYNLSKEDALNIGRKLNQESIVWKDDSFFGLIYCKDGSVDMTFKNNLKNMKFSEEDTKNLLQRLLAKVMLRMHHLFLNHISANIINKFTKLKTILFLDVNVIKEIN